MLFDGKITVYQVPCTVRWYMSGSKCEMVRELRVIVRNNFSTCLEQRKNQNFPNA